jgi:hypothetical protein
LIYNFTFFFAYEIHIIFKLFQIERLNTQQRRTDGRRAGPRGNDNTVNVQNLGANSIHEPLNLILPNNSRDVQRRETSAFVQPHNIACWPAGYYTPTSPPPGENLPRQPVLAHRVGRQRVVCSVRPSRRDPGPTRFGRWRPVSANDPRLNNRWLRRVRQQDGTITPEYWSEGEG